MRAALALVLVGWADQMAGVGPTLQVPRGPAPVIDGRIDSAEWRGAAVERLPNGLTIRLRHGGQYLFLAITSSAEGFPSVCAARADTVRVLHASAALGAVSYTRAGEMWGSSDTTFVYGMRNVALNEQAARERSEYLAAHRWVASTSRMGEGKAHEIQLSLALLDHAPRIAIGYYRTQGVQVAWPESLVSAGEGCAELELLRGYASAHPRFRPELYVELELEP